MARNGLISMPQSAWVLNQERCTRLKQEVSSSGKIVQLKFEAYIVYEAAWPDIGSYQYHYFSIEFRCRL